jgi:hypothetical protein
MLIERKDIPNTCGEENLYECSYKSYFWCAVSHNNFYFLILLFTSLHASASTGHPQVKYTQPFLKATSGTQQRLHASASTGHPQVKYTQPFLKATSGTQPRVAVALSGD